MSVHKLILEVTDPEDGAYFINKALTRIHGYLHRHGKNNIGLWFQNDTIILYASELIELEQILADNALVHDVNRHIFSAKFEQTDTEITLCKRRRLVNNSDINRKINGIIGYIKAKVKLSSEDIETKRQELLERYKQAKNNVTSDNKYFVIKTREKRFTIWVKPICIQNQDFVRQRFNSYGLLIANY
ncbi:MAG: type I-F CRISPR-associated endoribonuclease Cas6/Csy4 [Thiomargarita sp.]|nr:type I-F CRISPR-associated endoribonuclease Cas6/Csy4 [Bacteroidales bacterium]MCK5719687.1 type I-F CRISPR-associated endoribonuclease Cas6/Csy4 [Thiomargarita sp.]